MNVRHGIGNNCSGSYCHPFILETKLDVLYGSDPMLDRYQVIIDSCYDVSNMKV